METISLLSADQPVCVANVRKKISSLHRKSVDYCQLLSPKSRWRFRHCWRLLITGRANWHRMGAVIIAPRSGAVSIAVLSHELNFYATAHLPRLPPTEEARYRLPPCGWMTSSTYRFLATCGPNCLRVRTGATGISPCYNADYTSRDHGSSTKYRTNQSYISAASEQTPSI